MDLLQDSAHVAAWRQNLALPKQHQVQYPNVRFVATVQANWHCLDHVKAQEPQARSNAYVNNSRTTRKTRTPNASAKCEVAIPKATLKHCCVKERCFTLNSHVQTSDSFFSLQTQHTGTRKHKHNQKKEKTKKPRSQVPVWSLSVLWWN